MFKSRSPARDESWEGVVLGKSRGMPDGSYMYRYVKVRLPDGEDRKVRVSKGLWDSLTSGDTIVKEAGADPVKKN